jgi:hypothetical protein
MLDQKTIIEESPGPLSNRFHQIKAKLGWDAKEEPNLEDVQETPIDTTDLTSVEVGTSPEEIKEDDDIEIAEEDIVELTKIDDDIKNDDTDEDTEIVEIENVNVDIQTSPEEVSFFEDITPSATCFSDLTKENGMYTVKFRPIHVQTPVVILEEHQRRFAILRLPQKFCDFVENVEKSIGDAAKENREKWFKAPLDDDDISQGLKTFLDGNSLKVKVDEDFVLFDNTETCVDDITTPLKVRCILKASEICFGKSEFGTIFTLKQAQIAKTPKCKISKPTRDSEVSYFE